MQRLLGVARGRPEEHAIHFAVLRSLARAVYGPQPEGHYALASDCYCHFTSPIRRYPDLVVHRALDLLDKGRRAPEEGLVDLGLHCSQLERRAEAAERELVKLKILWFLSSRIGEEMDAVVTGVEAFGIFVQGLAIPAEGLVALADLPADSYRFDRASHSLSGRRPGQGWRLGDRVRVAVKKVDLDRRTLEFRLAGERARQPRGGRAARHAKKSRFAGGRGAKGKRGSARHRRGR